MDKADLCNAMRHGSKSSLDRRSATDLGRFGLGLKTASLSQCRRLTVVSKKLNLVHAIAWDLDEVALSLSWTASLLETHDIERLPFIALLHAQSQGTLVLWEKLDKLAEGDAGDGKVLSARMQDVAAHLALVFHRFLSGTKPRLNIRINGFALTPLDPFLEEDGSDRGPEEPIRVEDDVVRLQAFTIPHISRLTRAQIEKAGGETGLRRQQGFYVYRNLRLIVWGTWFRLCRQEELTKLTRVRVDVPTSLDHLWSLDIKKSTASPPESIRARLKALVPTLVTPSRTAIAYRGRIAPEAGTRPLWLRIDDRDGVRYQVDLDHPLLHALRLGADHSSRRAIDNVIRAISESLPVEPLYNDRANERLGHKQEKDDCSDAAFLEELARQLLSAFADKPEERERLLSGLHLIEPFAAHPKATKQLRSRLT